MYSKQRLKKTLEIIYKQKCPKVFAEAKTCRVLVEKLVNFRCSYEIGFGNLGYWKALADNEILKNYAVFSKVEFK